MSLTWEIISIVAALLVGGIAGFFIAQAYLKKNYAAPNHILIDDKKSNIDEWRAAGGIGILHTSAADTIQQLKKLGL